MREIYQAMIDESTPGRFEGEGPMTAYLYTLYMNGDPGEDWDEEASRYGKRILYWDDRGFITSWKCATVEEAMQYVDGHRDWEEE